MAGRSRGKLQLWCAMCAALLLSLQFSAQAEELSAYDVKAALIYNFLKFVELPAANAGTHIAVCTLSSSPGFDPLKSIEGKEVSGKLIRTASRTPGESLETCQVLFVHESASKNLSFLRNSGSGIFTIGESSGFCQLGGIVNFYLQDKKVRFEINAEAARSSGVTVSSKLMRIAGALTQPTAIPTDK